MKKITVVFLVLTGLLTGMAMNVAAQDSRDAWIPGIASFLIPGLGQLLNNQIERGIIQFGISMAIPATGMILAPTFPQDQQTMIYGVVLLATAGFRVYSGLDAYNVAKEQRFSLGMTEEGFTLSYRF